MKLLVLGGTKFLGRHTVEAALARGDEVTIFTRGQTNPELFPEVEKLRGDRDGDLGALEGRTWDAVIDPSCFVPRIARLSGELLRDAVERYVFVSTISVYGDFSKPIDESTPVGELKDPETEEVMENYGELKAACERVFDRIYGDRVSHVRAGLIVGPWDPTERFTYWPRRLAEGGEILAPGNPDAPVQFVDARDLAAWMLELAERGPGGAMNATGPAQRLTMRELLERIAPGANLHWVDDQALLDAGVGPWMELPLWLGDPDMACLMDVDVSKALAAGLTFRPVEDTARDTLAWSLEAGEQRETLSRAREREILQTQ